MRPKQKPAKRPDQLRRRPSKIPLTRKPRHVGARIPVAETASASTEPATGEPMERPAYRPRSCLFVDSSVRSGQTIEHIGGDVTVLGSVGSGAEIVAGGSIHVYGALRGRALAGVGGDRSARILCQKFEAELVAIDGSYRVADNIDPALRGHTIQARLEGAGMTLARMD